MGKNMESEMSFKEFINHIINPKIDSVITGIFEECPPFYHSCPVCNPGLIPDVLIKTESSDFQGEIEYVQEMFGLEDLEFPTLKNGDDSSWMDSFSQLTESELDLLVDFYKADLNILGYSTKQFYKLIK